MLNSNTRSPHYICMHVLQSSSLELNKQPHVFTHPLIQKYKYTLEKFSRYALSWVPPSSTYMYWKATWMRNTTDLTSWFGAFPSYTIMLGRSHASPHNITCNVLLVVTIIVLGHLHGNAIPIRQKYECRWQSEWWYLCTAMCISHHLNHTDRFGGCYIYTVKIVKHHMAVLQSSQNTVTSIRFVTAIHFPIIQILFWMVITMQCPCFEFYFTLSLPPWLSFHQACNFNPMSCVPKKSRVCWLNGGTLGY